MNGSMDYFRVYNKAVKDAEYYYTEKENINEEKISGYIGDLNSDGKVDIFDAVTLRKAVIDESRLDGKAIRAAADVNGDSNVNVADLVALQSFIIGREKSFPAGGIYRV